MYTHIAREYLIKDIAGIIKYLMYCRAGDEGVLVGVGVEVGVGEVENSKGNDKQRYAIIRARWREEAALNRWITIPDIIMWPEERRPMEHWNETIRLHQRGIRERDPERARKIMERFEQGLQQDPEERRGRTFYEIYQEAINEVLEEEKD